MAEDPEKTPSEEKSVFEPDELDIEDDEHVRVLGDNRYVVSADGPISKDSSEDPSSVDPTEPTPGREEGERSPQGEKSEMSSHEDRNEASPQNKDEAPPQQEHEETAEPHRKSTTQGQAPTDPLDGSLDVHRARARLTERMTEESGAYGFDVTAQFGDRVVQQHLQANDIVTVFDALLLWYAEHLDDETPSEEAIGLLLAESDIPIQFPTGSLYALVKAHGLEGSDTIADLVDAVDDDAIEFPPK